MEVPVTGDYKFDKRVFSLNSQNDAIEFSQGTIVVTVRLVVDVDNERGGVSSKQQAYKILRRGRDLNDCA